MFLLVRLVTVVTAITATIAPSYLQFYTQTYAGHQCHCKFRNRALDTWGLIVVKLRQGSGKEGQGMALKAKSLKA